MKNNIDTWTHTIDYPVDELIQSVCDNANTKYLLDLTKNKYNLIEKTVYDIAKFHSTILEGDNPENYFIEFICKSSIDTRINTHQILVDCDKCSNKEEPHTPILSCITYLNDVSNYPTIITNIDNDSYKFKKFEDQTDIVLSLPKANKQITFNGKYFHGSTTLTEKQDINDCYMIAINLWNIRPNKIPYYNIDNHSTINENMTFEKNKTIVEIIPKDTIGSIPVDNDVINYKLFNNILYMNTCDACFIFNDLIKQYYLDNEEDNTNTFKFILDNSIEETEETEETEKNLKNKKKILDDIYLLKNPCNKDKGNTIPSNDFKYNRFLQRFIYPNIYTDDMCNYIIGECNLYAAKNNGWDTQRHDSHPTTDLPVERIPSIFNLIIQSATTIIRKIRSSYEIPDDLKLDISDIFVVKYEHDKQNSLEVHTDESDFSFNILLSDKNKFEGGGTYFDDGLTTHLERGDLLIHSGKVLHRGLAINKGTRYVLVGFVKIIDEQI